jgi:hypothetical protein
MLPQKLVIRRIVAQKSSIYFGNFELHSFASEKNNARVIARNETGPSINRDAQLPVESPSKTITDMRRRDCNLPLNKKESKVICMREFEIILFQTQSLSINKGRLF